MPLPKTSKTNNNIQEEQPMDIIQSNIPAIGFPIRNLQAETDNPSPIITEFSASLLSSLSPPSTLPRPKSKHARKLWEAVRRKKRATMTASDDRSTSDWELLSTEASSSSSDSMSSSTFSGSVCGPEPVPFDVCEDWFAAPAEAKVEKKKLSPALFVPPPPGESRFGEDEDGDDDDDDDDDWSVARQLQR